MLSILMILLIYVSNTVESSGLDAEYGFERRSDKCALDNVAFSTTIETRVEQCAMACLAPTLYECISFTYNQNGNRHCRLYMELGQFVAADIASGCKYYERSCQYKNETHFIGETWRDGNCNCQCKTSEIESICTCDQENPGFWDNSVNVGASISVLVIFLVILPLVAVQWFWISYKGDTHEFIADSSASVSLEGPRPKKKRTSRTFHPAPATNAKCGPMGYGAASLIDDSKITAIFHRCCRFPRDRDLVIKTNAVLKHIPQEHLISLLCATAMNPMPIDYDRVIDEFLDQEFIASCGTVRVFLDRTELDIHGLQEAAGRKQDAKFDKEKFDLVCIILENPEEFNFPEDIQTWTAENIREYLLLEDLEEAAREMFENKITGKHLCKRNFGWDLDKLIDTFYFTEEGGSRFLKFIEIVQSDLQPVPLADVIDLPEELQPFEKHLDVWFHAVELAREDAPDHKSQHFKVKIKNQTRTSTTRTAMSDASRDISRPPDDYIKVISHSGRQPPKQHAAPSPLDLIRISDQESFDDDNDRHSTGSPPMKTSRFESGEIVVVAEAFHSDDNARFLFPQGQRLRICRKDTSGEVTVNTPDLNWSSDYWVSVRNLERLRKINKDETVPAPRTAVTLLRECGQKYEQYIDSFVNQHVSLEILMECSKRMDLFDNAFSMIIPDPLHRTVIRLRAKKSKDREDLRKFLRNIDPELTSYADILLNEDSAVSMEKMINYARNEKIFHSFFKNTIENEDDRKLIFQHAEAFTTSRSPDPSKRLKLSPNKNIDDLMESLLKKKKKGNFRRAGANKPSSASSKRKTDLSRFHSGRDRRRIFNQVLREHNYVYNMKEFSEVLGVSAQEMILFAVEYFGEAALFDTYVFADEQEFDERVKKQSRFEVVIQWVCEEGRVPREVYNAMALLIFSFNLGKLVPGLHPKLRALLKRTFTEEERKAMIYKDRFKSEEGLDDFTLKLCPGIDKIINKMFPEFRNPKPAVLDLLIILFGQPFVFLQMGPFHGTEALYMEWTRPDSFYPHYANETYLGEEDEVDFINSLLQIISKSRQSNDGSVIERPESNGCSIFLFPDHDVCLKVINKLDASLLYANGIFHHLRLITLNAPCVPELIAVVEAQDQVYVAMEKGRDDIRAEVRGFLSSHYRDFCSEHVADWEFDYVSPYIRSIARGLSLFHSVGVCHRKVDNSNMIIGADNQMKFIDFKQMRYYSLPERTHTIIEEDGSKKMDVQFRTNHMDNLELNAEDIVSPEKWQVIKKTLDDSVLQSKYYDAGKDEVFCFGVSLFEVSTGVLPFESLESIFLPQMPEADYNNCMNFLSGEYFAIKLNYDLKNVVVNLPNGENENFGNSWSQNLQDLIRSTALPQSTRVDFDYILSIDDNSDEEEETSENEAEEEEDISLKSPVIGGPGTQGRRGGFTATPKALDRQDWWNELSSHGKKLMSKLLHHTDVEAEPTAGEISTDLPSPQGSSQGFGYSLANVDSEVYSQYMKQLVSVEVSGNSWKVDLWEDMGFTCRLKPLMKNMIAPNIEVIEWSQDLLLEKSFEDDGWQLMSGIFEVRSTDRSVAFSETKVLMQTNADPPPGWEYFVVHGHEDGAEVLSGFDTEVGVQISTEKLGWFFVIAAESVTLLCGKEELSDFFSGMILGDEEFLTEVHKQEIEKMDIEFLDIIECRIPIFTGFYHLEWFGKNALGVPVRVESEKSYFDGVFTKLSQTQYNSRCTSEDIRGVELKIRMPWCQLFGSTYLTLGSLSTAIILEILENVFISIGTMHSFHISICHIITAFLEKELVSLSFGPSSATDWGASVSFDLPCDQWVITRLSPGGQFLVQGCKVGWRLKRVNQLHVIEQNRSQLERILRNGLKCTITFSTSVSELEQTNSIQSFPSISQLPSLPARASSKLSAIPELGERARSRTASTKNPDFRQLCNKFLQTYLKSNNVDDVATLYPSQIHHLQTLLPLTPETLMEYFVLSDGAPDLRTVNALIFAFKELDDLDSTDGTTTSPSLAEPEETMEEKICQFILSYMEKCNISSVRQNVFFQRQVSKKFDISDAELIPILITSEKLKRGEV